MLDVAFDVCHDVYERARGDRHEDSYAEYGIVRKIYVAPDRMPRLAEYVADFARARRAGARRSRTTLLSVRSDASRAQSNASIRSLSAHGSASGRNGQARVPVLLERVRASRMAMFRVYYLGGAEYQAARRHLGISEFTWADWAEEIRTRVGRELAQAGVFPPSNIFILLRFRPPETPHSAKNLRAFATGPPAAGSPLPV